MLFKGFVELLGFMLRFGFEGSCVLLRSLQICGKWGAAAGTPNNLTI